MARRIELELYGVLDKCAECGDFVGYAEYTGKLHIECSGCGQLMGPFKLQWEAMVGWNLEQRKLKPVLLPEAKKIQSAETPQPKVLKLRRPKR